jgi:hypothetical protein
MAMSLSISSAKHVGAGRLKSFDNCGIQCPKKLNMTTAFKCRLPILLAALLWGYQPPAVSAPSGARAPSISEAAAVRCNKKLKQIEDFSALNGTGKNQTVRFTEEEINSFLTLDKSVKLNSCFKNLEMAFKEGILEGVASIDFDCLKETASKSIPRFISQMFSGIHIVSTRGKIESANGEGSIQLEQTRFNNTTIPNFLIKEAVVALCKHQKSPFNPLETSALPHAIKKITVHPGYIVVYQ